MNESVKHGLFLTHENNRDAMVEIVVAGLVIVHFSIGQRANNHIHLKFQIRNNRKGRNYKECFLE